MVKLNIGCGLAPRKEGYLGVDIRALPTVDFVCNYLEIDRHYSNVDEIYARHTFEHLNFKDFDKGLQVVYNTLKPGGVFNIIVPDLVYHFKQISDSENLFKPSDLNNGYTNYYHAMTSLYGCQEHEKDYHLNGFTEFTLGMKLRDAGFEDILRKLEKPWNLNIVCKKAA